MNKRIVPLLLSIVMMCSLLVAAVPAWAEPADSGVSASVTQASPGETFSVTLKVPGTAKPINEMSLKVHFNKAVFEVTEYTAPAITGMDLMQSNLSDANRNGFFSAGYTSKSDEADVELTGLELTAWSRWCRASAGANPKNWRQKNSSAKLKSGRRVSGSIAVLAFLKAICSIGTLQLMMVRTRA